MAQHFLLSAKASTLSVQKMTELINDHWLSTFPSEHLKST